jgi:hypothetical protein
MRCGILLLQEKFQQKWNMGRVFTGEGNIPHLLNYLLMLLMCCFCVICFAVI